MTKSKVKTPKNIEIFDDKGKRYAKVGTRTYQLPPKGDASFERFIIAALLEILRKDRKKKRKRGKKNPLKKDNTSNAPRSSASGINPPSQLEELQAMRGMMNLKPTVNVPIPSMSFGLPGQMQPMILPPSFPEEKKEAKRPPAIPQQNVPRIGGPQEMSEDEMKSGLQGVQGITVTYEDGKQRAATPAYIEFVKEKFRESSDEAKKADAERKRAVVALEVKEKDLQRAVDNLQRAEEKGRGNLSQLTREVEKREREANRARSEAADAISQKELTDRELREARAHLQQLQRAVMETKENNDKLLQDNARLNDDNIRAKEEAVQRQRVAEEKAWSDVLKPDNNLRDSLMSAIEKGMGQKPKGTTDKLVKYALAHGHGRDLVMKKFNKKIKLYGGESVPDMGRSIYTDVQNILANPSAIDLEFTKPKTKKGQRKESDEEYDRRMEYESLVDPADDDMYNENSLSMLKGEFADLFTPEAERIFRSKMRQEPLIEVKDVKEVKRPRDDNLALEDLDSLSRELDELIASSPQDNEYIGLTTDQLNKAYDDIMGGDGYIGSKNAKGLTTAEIDKVMNRKGAYIATIPADGILPIILPQLRDDRKACFILNLDPMGMPGSHWVAVMIWPKEHRLMYFDSFGKPPPAGILRDLKTMVKKAYTGKFKFKWNQIKWQDVRTDTCGFHAMKFLKDMLAGKSFPEASGFNQARRGERDVKKFKENLEKFGYL